ncbi:hypothetical protein HKX48_009213 [Thoreauomyces humboldtii]|nr:hypothetical protein HKX48_009213 [Thoreauomyces humboldtii]
MRNTNVLQWFPKPTLRSVVQYRDPDAAYQILADRWDTKSGLRLQDHEWQHLLEHVSRSKPDDLARGRIMTALRWKLRSRVPISPRDVFLLADVTKQERKTVEDVEGFMQDSREQLGVESDVSTVIRLIYGLAQYGDGEEAGRFVERALANKIRAQQWTPAYFETVILGLGAQWKQDVVSDLNVNRSRMGRLEADMEQAIRHIIVIYREAFGSARATTALYNSIARVVQVSTSSYDDARLFIRRMDADGFTADMETFNILHGHLIHNNQLEGSAHLLADAKRRGLEPNWRTTQSALNGFVRAAEKERVVRLWDDLSDRDRLSLVDADNALGSTLIVAFARWNEIRSAQSVAEAMLARNALPSQTANSSLIRQLLKSPQHGLSYALEHYHTVHRIMRKAQAVPANQHLSPQGTPLSVDVHNILIDRCIYAKDLDMAMHIYNGMSEIGVQPDVVTLTPVIHALARRGQHEDVQGLLTEMANQGIEPDIYVFSGVLSSLVTSGRMAECHEVLKIMKASNVEPNEYVWHILINGYVQGGEMKKAEALADRMGGRHKRTAIANNTILNGYVKNGNESAVRNLWARMQELNEMDLASHHIMFTFLFSRGELDTVVSLFDELSRSELSHMQPNWGTYTSLIEGFLKAGRDIEALEYYEQLLESDLPVLNANPFRRIISRLASESRVEVAERVLVDALRVLPTRMIDDGLYAPIVYAIARSSGSLMAVYKNLDRLRSRGVSLSGPGYAAVITAHTITRQFRMAVDFIEAARTSAPEVQANAELMHAVLDWHAKQGAAQEMEEMAVEMCGGTWGQSIATKPSQVTPESLLRALTSTRVLENSLRPTLSTFAILIAGYGFARRWQDAAILYRYLRSNPGKVPMFDEQHVMKAGEELFPTHGVSPSIVSVFLDALGFAENRQELRATWRDLCHARYPLDVNNWTSYLEALMRCGLIDEVLIILNSSNMFAVDVKTLRNVLGLARVAAARNAGSADSTGGKDGLARSYEQRIRECIATHYPEVEEAVQKSERFAARAMEDIDAVVQHQVLPVPLPTPRRQMWNAPPRPTYIPEAAYKPVEIVEKPVMLWKPSMLLPTLKRPYS